MADLSGHSLGRYHLLERLGEGGMAVVYKAFDTRLDRDVAVKIIRIERLTPEQLPRALKRFEREAKALGKLTHPNIVTVSDYGEFEGMPYLVMPYLSGGTLKEKLGQPIGWRDALKIVIPIARALEYAHQRGIIHRDVKSSNILITDSGQPMISDFGVAKILSMEETVDLTGTGMGVGTPEYMAPEQWNGKTLPQSDQYALGVVLYEMLTGRKPYTAETPAAILLKQATEPLERPGKFVRDMPEKAERLLLKALARDPQDRYTDIGVFADALEGLLSDTATAKKAKTVAPARAHDTLETFEQAVPEHKQPTKQTRFGPNWRMIGILGAALFIFSFFLTNIDQIPSATPSTKEPTSTATNKAVTPASTQILATPTITEIPATPTPQLGIGSTMTGTDGMTLLYVPAGEFIMGSEDGDPNEKPVSQIYLDNYWIDQTEVTNEMYTKCVNEMACELPSIQSHYYDQSYMSHPVVGINLYHAEDYCAWTGRRLPTDAEWEKAASWNERNQEKFIFPWGNDVNCSLANYLDGSRYCVKDTSPVGSYPNAVSPYGALDMAGNVWEVVSSGYLRGGAWNSKSADIRSTNRDTLELAGLREENRGWYTWIDTSKASLNIPLAAQGFRCAMDVAP